MKEDGCLQNEFCTCFFTVVATTMSAKKLNIKVSSRQGVNDATAML
jgi:hypothetical protein